MNLFKKPVFIAVCFVLLVKPGFIAGMPMFSAVDSFIDVLRVLIIIFCCICMMKSKFCWNRLFQVFCFIILNELWKILSTALHGNTFSGWGNLLNTFGIALFTFFALSKDEKAFYHGSSLTLGCYVILNFLTVIVFPGGMYATSQYTANYFLSYRTAWVPIYFFALVVTFIRREKEPTLLTKTWSIVVLICATASMVLVWTATGIVSLSIAVIFLLARHNRKRAHTLKIRTIIMTELIIFYAIVFLNIQMEFSDFFETVLMKDVTFSQRLRIWGNAISSIHSHFLIGNGNLTASAARSILGWGSVHAHNFYLNELFYYGLIGLVISLLIIYLSAKDLPMDTDHNRVVNIIKATMIALMTAFQMEAYFSIDYYLCPVYLIAASLSVNKLKKMRKYRYVIERRGNTWRGLG